MPPFPQTTREVSGTLQRFPQDKSVLIQSAQAPADQSQRNLKILAGWYPHDPFILRLLLENTLAGLTSARIAGPLTNRDYPKPPLKPKPLTETERASWRAAIDLARRGQQLEPNNTYFDWVLLYSLFATNQDAQARQTLKQAALKTAYDGHSREDFVYRITYLKLKKRFPLTPIELFSTSSAWSSESLSKIREVARQTMETVISDRQAGKHDRAINTALDLLKLSRTMRKSSYSFIESIVGSSCEKIALTSMLAPSKGGGISPARLIAGTSLASLHSYPGSLYAYAKSQGRNAILPALDAEWLEMGKWSAGFKRALSNYDGYQTYSLNDVVIIGLTERLRTILLRILPSVLILGILFGLLSYRFPPQEPTALKLWRGMAIGSTLVGGTLLYEMAFALIRTRDDFDDWREVFARRSDFVPLEIQWIRWGLAGAMLCFGLHCATRWQKQRDGKNIGIKTSIRNAFHAPEDGLTRFDFGWLLGYVSRLTLWLLFLGSVIGFCVDVHYWVVYFSAAKAWMLAAFWLTVSLALQLWAWSRHSNRVQAIPIGFRSISKAMTAFFFVISIGYLMVSLAVLPLIFGFQRDFEKSVQVGEIQLARDKFGF